MRPTGASGVSIMGSWWQRESVTVACFLRKWKGLEGHESLLGKKKRGEQNTGRPSRGIKGQSILLLLAFFHFSGGFVVDYMHAVWPDLSNTQHACSFTLKNKISAVDQRRLSLQPMYEMLRLPQSFHRRYWKKSKCRNLLPLYFFPVAPRGISPAVYFKNWIEFVHIVHSLLMESIPLD